MKGVYQRKHLKRIQYLLLQSRHEEFDLLTAESMSSSLLSPPSPLTSLQVLQMAEVAPALSEEAEPSSPGRHLPEVSVAAPANVSYRILVSFMLSARTAGA